MNITVKILSGETVSLIIDKDNNKYEERILEKLNEINPIQYPLKRTKLLKEEKDHEKDYSSYYTYYAFIDTHLLLSLTHISKVYTDGNGFKIKINPTFPEEQKFKEGMDGISFDEWRGFEHLQIKFEMPNSTMYRLFVVSLINCERGGPIISYKYDTDSKEEYERIAELLKNKKIKLDEERIKNIMLNLIINKLSKDTIYYRKIQDISKEEKDKLYKDEIYFRDDSIIVLNCNGDIVYTDHYHWYHYEQQQNWDYYEY
jgi:hypothetical protein